MSGRFVSVVSLFCEENENHKDTMTTVSVATTIATLATRLLLQLLWCFAGMIRRFVSFHHVYSFRHHLDIVAQENVGICSEIFCPCYCDVSCRCCRHWTWLGQKKLGNATETFVQHAMHHGDCGRTRYKKFRPRWPRRTR